MNGLESAFTSYFRRTQRRRWLGIWSGQLAGSNWLL